MQDITYGNEFEDFINMDLSRYGRREDENIQLDYGMEFTEDLRERDEQGWMELDKALLRVDSYNERRVEQEAPVVHDFFEEEEESEVSIPTLAMSGKSKKIGKSTTQKKKQIKESKKSPESDSGNLMKSRRRLWSEEEDNTVLALVEKYGTAWTTISTHLEGRTGKQVRDRYINKLQPGLKNTEWTNEEDQALIAIYLKIGTKWTLIADQIPGRTESQVKNRFYNYVKKYLLNEDGTPINPVAEIKIENNLDAVSEHRSESEVYSPSSHALNVTSPQNCYDIEVPVREELNVREPSSFLSLDYCEIESNYSSVPSIQSQQSFNNVLENIVNNYDIYNRFAPSRDNAKTEALRQLAERKRQIEILLQKTVQDMAFVEGDMMIGDF